MESNQEIYQEARQAAKRDIDLEALRKQFAGADYRQLVQRHLRKMRTTLKDAIIGSALAFNEAERPIVEALIDEYNAKGYQPGFWREDCGEILHRICSDFTERMEKKGLVAKDWLKFNVFQIITMNFAEMAREQKELRRFAGIRKSLLFR